MSNEACRRRCLEIAREKLRPEPQGRLDEGDKPEPAHREAEQPAPITPVE